MSFDLKENQKRQNTSFFAVRKRLERILYPEEFSARRDPEMKEEPFNPQQTAPMHIHLLNAATNSTVIYSQNPKFVDKFDSPENEELIERYEKVAVDIYKNAQKEIGRRPNFSQFIQSALKSASLLRVFDQDFAAMYFASRGQKLSAEPSFLEKALQECYEEHHARTPAYRINAIADYPSDSADFFIEKTAPFILVEYLQFRNRNEEIRTFLEKFQKRRISISIVPFKILNQFRAGLVAYDQTWSNVINQKLRNNYDLIREVLEAQSTQIVLGSVSFALQFDTLSHETDRPDRMLESLGALWFCKKITVTRDSVTKTLPINIPLSDSSKLFSLPENYVKTIELERDKCNKGNPKLVILDILGADHISFECPLLEKSILTKTENDAINEDEEYASDSILTMTYIKNMADSFQSLKDLSDSNLKGQVSSIFNLTTAIYKDTLETMDGLSSRNNPIALALRSHDRISCINQLTQSYWALGELTNYSERRLLGDADLNLFDTNELTPECVVFWVSFFASRGFYQIASQVGKASLGCAHEIDYRLSVNGDERKTISIAFIGGQKTKLPSIDSICWDASKIWPVNMEVGRPVWATPGLCFISNFPIWYIGKAANEFFRSDPAPNQTVKKIELRVDFQISENKFDITVSGAPNKTIVKGRVEEWEKGLQAMHPYIDLTLGADSVSQYITFSQSK